MKIFQTQPTLSKEDEAHLKPLLGNYVKLVDELANYEYSQEDLKKLVLIELKNNRRKFILQKLASRIVTKKRENILNNITKCLNQSLKQK